MKCVECPIIYIEKPGIFTEDVYECEEAKVIFDGKSLCLMHYEKAQKNKAIVKYQPAPAPSKEKKCVKVDENGLCECPNNSQERIHPKNL